MPLPNIYPVNGASGGAICKPWRGRDTERERIIIKTTTINSV